jgi:hypothetical protein
MGVDWGTTLPLGEDRGMVFAVDEMTALRWVALAVVISNEAAGRWSRLRDSETKHDDEATGVEVVHKGYEDIRSKMGSIAEVDAVNEVEAASVP